MLMLVQPVRWLAAWRGCPHVVTRHTLPLLETRMPHAARSALVQPSTPPDVRLELLQQLTGEAVFRTKLHRQVVGILVARAAALAANVYAGSNGAHAALLQGAPRCGKSALLVLFTRICHALFPGVIPLYVSFAAGAGLPPCQPLLKVVARELQRERVLEQADLDADPTEQLDVIVRALLRANKKLLVLVDGLDQLYRLQPSSQQADAAVRTLGFLSGLGTQRSGAVGVLLCGSSALCGRLIARQGVAALQADFPLVQRAPSLNATKFCGVSLPGRTCVDLEAHQAVLSQGTGAAPSVEDCRLAAFAGWCVPAGTPVEPSAARAWGAVRSRLVADNEALLRSLVVRGAVSPQRVKAVQWESAFKPVPLGALRPDDADFEYSVCRLLDSGHLSLDAALYPGALSQLFSPRSA